MERRSEGLQGFVAAGVSVQAADSGGNTALHRAARGWDDASVALLAALGAADVNATA